MAEKAEYEVGIEYTSKGSAQVQGDLDRLIDKIDKLARENEITSKAQDQLSSAVTRTGTALNNTASSTSKSTSEWSKFRSEVLKADAALGNLAKSAAAGGSRTPTADVSSLITDSDIDEFEAMQQAQTSQLQQASQRRTKLRREEAAAAAKIARDQAALEKRIETEKSGRGYANASVLYDAEISARQKNAQSFSELIQARLRDEVAAEKQATATRSVTVATQDSEQAIVALRYASYDIGRTFLTISAGITAVGVGVASAFASQEREFANVIRTAEGGVGDLESALHDLSTAIPVSFNELSKIATLGNQLGVAGEDIEAFTQTIATFSAATGIGFEASAEAFGKLGNLLGVGADEYDRLGSSIAYVGRTTAASESEIISISKEIAPAAAAAGFAADEVIGLSGALGSLAVPPERSRSTILQFFESLNNATAKGGQDLQDFAKVVGVTASELEQMVRSGRGEEVLTRFIGNVSSQDTVELTQALQNLGLAGLRTNPTIRALAQNTDLLARSMQNGRQAWQENLELQRQMDIINQTVSASWDKFVNSLMNAAASIGDEVAPAVKRLLDLGIELLNGFSEFVESDFGGWLVRTAATLATAATAFLAIRGAIALATGSALAFKFALSQGIGFGLISGLKGLATAFGLVGSGATAGSIGVNKFAFALRALGRATIIIGVLQYISEWLFNTGETAVSTGDAFLTLGEIVAGVMETLWSISPALGAVGFALAKPAFDIGNALKDWGASLKSSKTELESAGSGMSDFGDYTGRANDLMGDLGDNTGGVADGVSQAVKEVRTLLDYAEDLSSVWSRAFDIRFSGQSTLDTVTSQFIKIREENQRAAKAIRDLRNDIRSLNSDISIQEYYLSIAVEYGDTARANAIEAELEKTRADLADKTAELQKEEDKARKSLKGNSEAAIENRKTILDLVSGYQDHIKALAASGMSQAQLLRESAILRREFIQQATQLGYNRKEVETYAKAFDDVAYAIRNIPRDITVRANANPAIQALNEMKAAADKANSSLGKLKNRTISINTKANNSGIIKSLEAQYSMYMARYKAAKKLGEMSIANRMNGAAIDILQELRKQRGYAQGGYTGPGGKYEPAGVVHRGEYVIPKRDVNQATGMPYADALGRLMTGVRGYANGGYVRPAASSAQGGVVALSAGSIQQLANAVRQYIVVDNQILGETTSNAYAQSTAVGAN